MARVKTKVLNYAMGEVVTLPAGSRCGRTPKSLRVPPYFADSSSFDEMIQLRDVSIGEEVFIEWKRDRFCSFEPDTYATIVGPTVWRLAKVIEHLGGPVIEKDE